MKAFLLSLLCLPCLVFSQKSTGINNSNPSPKAALDVMSNGKQGILFPRLSAADTLLIAPGGGTNKGLTFYDSTNAKFWYWTGAKWFGLSGAALSGGAWNLTGNAASTTHFIGTTNATPLILKASNTQMVSISTDAPVTAGNYEFGVNSLFNSYSFRRNTSAQNNINPMLYLIAASNAGYSSAASLSLTNNKGQATFGLSDEGNFAVNMKGNVGLSSDNLTVFPNGTVSIGSVTSSSSLSVASLSNWNLASTEGDFLVGTPTYRFKVGVSTAGGGAGDVYVGAHGGSNRMFIGTGPTNFQTLTIAGANVGIGSTTPTAPLQVKGRTIIEDGHLTSLQAVAPTIALNTTAYGGTATIGALSTDVAGSFAVSVTTSTCAGCAIATVTFNTPYTSAPVVVLTPNSLWGAIRMTGFEMYVSSTTTGFSIYSNQSPAASNSMGFNYMVIEGK